MLHPVGISVTGWSGGQLSYDPLGDGARAFRYTLGVKKDSQTDTFGLDFVFVRRGRVVVAASFIEQSSSPFVYTEHAILAKGIARAPLAS